MPNEPHEEPARKFVVSIKPAFTKMFSVRILGGEAKTREFEDAGFTDLVGVYRRLREKYGNAQKAIDKLRAGEGLQLESDARKWESWEQFRDFWFSKGTRNAR